jgi:hypothetical protein
VSADVISKCTRNGVTSWSNVAKMLGCSVDKAKALHGHLTPRQDPQQIVDNWAMSDAEAYRSPHPKGDGLKAQLLGLMERHGRLSTEQLAVLASSTPDSIRRRVNDLVAARLVEHDGCLPRTWGLTTDGKTIARAYHERPGQVGRGTETKGSVAA